MTRRPRNPSEDFSAGYEAGRAAKFREHAIELDKLKALTALLEARFAQAAARAEAAEKRLAKAEGKRKPRANAVKEEAGGFEPGVAEQIECGRNAAEKAAKRKPKPVRQAAKRTPSREAGR